jgi:NADH dehydrogenase (ubiquinone) 1 alpha subcomplex subunit 9
MAVVNLSACSRGLTLFVVVCVSRRSGITCTVFGATGFLGRYVAHHVAKSGSRMILPTRCGENDRQHLKVMGDLGQIVQMDYNIRDEEAIRFAVERSNVVINLVGREWETRNFSFDDVHVTFPKKLAEICADVGVRRLIHVSALGAQEDHPSAYFRTKAAGEAAVREAFPSATIVRPAKMVGVEDRFLNVFAEHSRKYPAVPLIDGGDSKQQPVFVDDVAVAVRQIVHDELTSGRTYELAGEKVYSMDDLAKLVLRTTRSRRSTTYIPSFIMKALSCPHEYLLRRVPVPMPTPVGLTRSYIDAQERDYVKQPDSLGFSDLGIKPHALEGYVLDYLRSFRAGGYEVGEAPWEIQDANALETRA